MQAGSPIGLLLALTYAAGAVATVVETIGVVINDPGNNFTLDAGDSAIILDDEVTN